MQIVDSAGIVEIRSLIENKENSKKISKVKFTLEYIDSGELRVLRT